MYKNMYLKGPRMFFFALTTALSITTLGLASWGLKVLNDRKNLVKHQLPGAALHADPILAVGGALTAASGYASLACTIMALLMIFSPRHEETLTTVRIKEGVFAFAVIFEFGVLIACTVVTASQSATVTAPGIPPALIAAAVAASGQKLAYKDSTPPVAYTSVGWVCWLSTIISLILVSMAARHALKHGHPEPEAGYTSQNKPLASGASGVDAPTSVHSDHGVMTEKH